MLAFHHASISSYQLTNVSCNRARTTAIPTQGSREEVTAARRPPLRTSRPAWPSSIIPHLNTAHPRTRPPPPTTPLRRHSRTPTAAPCHKATARRASRPRREATMPAGSSTAGTTRRMVTATNMARRPGASNTGRVTAATRHKGRPMVTSRERTRDSTRRRRRLVRIQVMEAMHNIRAPVGDDPKEGCLINRSSYYILIKSDYAT